jgi:hypothetical protein
MDLRAGPSRTILGGGQVEHAIGVAHASAQPFYGRRLPANAPQRRRTKSRPDRPHANGLQFLAVSRTFSGPQPTSPEAPGRATLRKLRWRWGPDTGTRPQTSQRNDAPAWKIILDSHQSMGQSRLGRQRRDPLEPIRRKTDRGVKALRVPPPGQRTAEGAFCCTSSMWRRDLPLNCDPRKTAHHASFTVAARMRLSIGHAKTSDTFVPATRRVGKDSRRCLVTEDAGKAESARPFMPHLSAHQMLYWKACPPGWTARSPPPLSPRQSGPDFSFSHPGPSVLLKGPAAHAPSTRYNRKRDNPPSAVSVSISFPSGGPRRVVPMHRTSQRRWEIPLRARRKTEGQGRMSPVDGHYFTVHDRTNGHSRRFANSHR